MRPSISAMELSHAAILLAADAMAVVYTGLLVALLLLPVGDVDMVVGTMVVPGAFVDMVVSPIEEDISSIMTFAISSAIMAGGRMTSDTPVVCNGNVEVDVGEMVLLETMDNDEDGGVVMDDGWVMVDSTVSVINAGRT